MKDRDRVGVRVRVRDRVRAHGGHARYLRFRKKYEVRGYRGQRPEGTNRHEVRSER